MNFQKFLEMTAIFQSNFRAEKSLAALFLHLNLAIANVSAVRDYNWKDKTDENKKAGNCGQFPAFLLNKS